MCKNPKLFWQKTSNYYGHISVILVSYFKLVFIFIFSIVIFNLVKNCCNFVLIFTFILVLVFLKYHYMYLYIFIHFYFSYFIA